MPRMRGFLLSRPKIGADEWERSQARVDARLAALFRASGATQGATGEDTSRDGAEHASAVDRGSTDTWAPQGPEGPGQWLAGPRPPIVVSGDPDATDAEAAGATGDLVGVMDRASTVAADDIWQLPLPGGRGSGFEAAPQDRGNGAGPPLEAIPEELWPSPDAPGPEPAEPTVVVLPHSPARAPKPRAAAGAARARPPAGRKTAQQTPAPAAATAFCPYCAVALVPAPTSGRRCTRCRQPIAVKHLEGRVVYLTEAAVAVFDAEQRRLARAALLTRERDRWLRLAATVRAPADRRTRLAAARPSEDVVVAARTLYQGTVDRAFKAAKVGHDWERAARIRRDNAMALHRMAGSPSAPSAEVVGLYREGVAAELSGIAEISRDAELVSASCCDACRADDHVIFRIANQLRAPRLPHEGCPKGLCRCSWDLSARDRETMRRYLRRHPGTEAKPAMGEATAPGEAVASTPSSEGAGVP